MQQLNMMEPGFRADPFLSFIFYWHVVVKVIRSCRPIEKGRLIYAHIVGLTIAQRYSKQPVLKYAAHK
jgi:hypothetical protein